MGILQGFVQQEEMSVCRLNMLFFSPLMTSYLRPMSSASSLWVQFNSHLLFWIRLLYFSLLMFCCPLSSVPDLLLQSGPGLKSILFHSHLCKILTECI